jgi:hypothetical protein
MLISSKTLERLALGGQEHVEFDEPIYFRSFYNRVRVKKGKNVYMDGWPVVMCDTKEVLSAEIYINYNCTKTGASAGCLPSAGFFNQVKDGYRVKLFPGGNVLNISHRFCFNGDSRLLHVHVVAEIPAGREDIIQEAKRIVDLYGSREAWGHHENVDDIIVDWNGKELYDYLNDQGITQVRFDDITLITSVVRAGSIAHQIRQAQIKSNRVNFT